jgi:hypothetical protein
MVRRFITKEAVEDDPGGWCDDGHGTELGWMLTAGGRRGDQPNSVARCSVAGGCLRRGRQRSMVGMRHKNGKAVGSGRLKRRVCALGHSATAKQARHVSGF